MREDRSTPFWDVSLTDEQRIDWLLSHMTIEEKLRSLSSRGCDLDRLGIPGYSLGGEAAHGVEGRNDQNGLGAADITTSFVQPIGMSASWDTQLIRQAGEVTGIQARTVFHRHRRGGLSRWAPTVDLERDPRWGRNEEGYGEDPVLTGAMASAYVKGMQGEDPYYVRCAATLKHFYANNTEEGRTWKNASVDARNRYELYLEPFRRCIEEGGALGVMTAYNRINGSVGILNREVRDILKKQYGLKHAVSDGGAMELAVTAQHYYGLHAETIAGALKAGVDAMSDRSELVEQAAFDAYELGLLTEEQIDEALRNTFGLKLRLGLYDRIERNPYDRVSEDDLDDERSRSVSLSLAREAVILLKNEEHTLPLSPDMDPGDLAVIGPLSDVWYQDWYGGTPPYRTTLLQGVRQVLSKDGQAQKEDIPCADGLDRVTLRCGQRYLAVAEDRSVYLSETPEIWIREEWGEGKTAFFCVRTGTYLCTRRPRNPQETDVEEGRIAADRDQAFNWFVTEIFHVFTKADHSVTLTDRFDRPVYLRSDGAVMSDLENYADSMVFEIEIIENGIEKAANLAKGKKTVLLALGCHPMISAKEEVDRKTLELAPKQRKLLEAVRQNNSNIVLVLFANYPYTLKGVEECIPAILTSATGSQDMGRAVAETIFGLNAPAGRLNMTWYQDISQLPDMDDYDIIKGKRTYRYFDGPVLYPFGYGLTYTTFAYDSFFVSVKDCRSLEVSLRVTNTGECTSDEVVQIYAKAPSSRVKKPICQLIGFTRVKGIQPKETRKIRLEIPVSELRFYDVISQTLMVEEGNYRIYAGASCKDEACSQSVWIPGQKTGIRDMTGRIRADHSDDSENIAFEEGHLRFCAAVPKDREKTAGLTYRDCGFHGEDCQLALYIKSENGGRIEVLLDGVCTAVWEGDTREWPHQSANFKEVVCKLGEQEGVKTLKLTMQGDIKLCWLRLLPSGFDTD